MRSLGDIRERRPLTARSSLSVLLVALALMSGAAAPAASAASPLSGTYYVSPSGDDSAAGTTPATAWRTLGRVNGATFGPGATILLQGGHTFTGGLTFAPADRGTPSRPITVGSYGKEPATIRARRSGILIRDTAGFRIHDLHILGPGLPRLRSAGIAALNDLSGNVKLSFLRIDAVEVSGFRWGIFVFGSKGTSGFKDVRITRVVAHDNILSGIDVEAAFSSSGTYAHENVYVGRSIAYHNLGLTSDANDPTGNGILLSEVDGGRSSTASRTTTAASGRGRRTGRSASGRSTRTTS